MQVYSFFGRELVVALRSLLQLRESGHLGGAACGLGLGPQRFLLCAAPAADAREAGADFLGLGRYGVGCRACAEWNEVLAVVLLAETVLQAVLAVAVGAVHAGVVKGVDERFAFWLGALRRCEGCGFLCAGEGRGWCADAVFPSVLGPFAGVGAFVSRLGPVVEAECVVAGVAAEGEEVELVAVGELAVRADGFEVVVVHFGEGLVGRRGVVGGILGGHDEGEGCGEYIGWVRCGRVPLRWRRCRLLGSRQSKGCENVPPRESNEPPPLQWRLGGPLKAILIPDELLHKAEVYSKSALVLPLPANTTAR